MLAATSLRGGGGGGGSAERTRAPETASQINNDLRYKTLR